MRHVHRFPMLRLVALFAALVISPVRADTETPINFGVVPQQAAAKLARGWLPITRWLGERLGRRVVFRTAPSIPEFERRVAAGEYDIAYMNPYHYTAFSERPGYRAIARQRDKRIRGILVTRRGGGAESLADLQGQTLAFPSPAAFAASVLTRAYLQQQGLDFEPKYVQSHDSVYRAVAAGLYPAGGGVRRTLAAMEAPVAAQLRVLWESDGYTPHAFAVHPAMPESLAAELQLALLALEDEPQGRELLAGIKFKGMQVAEDGDWDDVRALGIDLLN